MFLHVIQNWKRFSKVTLILNGKHMFVYGGQIYRKNITIYFYQGNLLKFMGNQKTHRYIAGKFLYSWISMFSTTLK